jgi:hypothetical protein
MTPHLTAVHMILNAVHMMWGAVNVWIIHAAYARPAKLADQPTLSILLKRVMKQERRRFDCYSTEAPGHLTSSRTAQRSTRLALRHFWAPVGSGGGEGEEVDFLRDYPFGDPDGLDFAARIDRRVYRLPGLHGLHLISGAVAAQVPVERCIDQ